MICFFLSWKLPRSKENIMIMVPLSNLSPLELCLLLIGFIDLCRRYRGYWRVNNHPLSFHRLWIFFLDFDGHFAGFHVEFFISLVTLVWKTYIPRFFQHGEFPKQTNAVDLESAIQKSTTKILLFGIHSPNFFLGSLKQTHGDVTRVKWPFLFTTPVWWPVFTPAAPFTWVSYRAGGRFLCVFGGIL